MNSIQSVLSPCWILIALVIGLVLAMIATRQMKSELKTVHSKAAANDYVKSGSLDITESREVFLYNQITKTPRARDNNPPGGGGGNRGGSGIRSAASDMRPGRGSGHAVPPGMGRGRSSGHAAPPRMGRGPGGGHAAPPGIRRGRGGRP